MPKYRIEGQIYDAASPDEAYAQHDQRLTAAPKSPADVAAMSHMRSSTQVQPKSYPEMLHYDPEKGFRPVTGLEKLGYGFGLGARNIAANVGEAVGLVSPERVKEMREEGAPITEQFPGNIGAFMGEQAPAYAVGAGAGSTAMRLGAGPVVRGIAEGAAQGYLTAAPEDRGSGFWSGGAVGAALPSASRMAKMLSQARAGDKSARVLTSKGVELTPGQMRPEGSFAQIEEVLSGVPVIGPKITAARARGWEQTQRVIAQEAAPPGFVVPPRKDPAAMFNDLADAYDEAYKVGKGYGALPVIVRTGTNIPLASALQVPKTAVADDASRAYANSFLSNLTSSIKGKGANLKSDDLFEMRSQLRAEIRKLNKQPNAPFKAADLLEAAEGRITEALESQLPPDVMPSIRAIDAKYGNFKIIENALERAKDQPGGFTPSQFSQAVRQATPSGRTYAAGGGRMRNISSAAADVFQPRQPMTGRQLIVAAPAALAAALGASAAPVVTGVTAGLAATPYMKGSVGQAARSILSGDTRLQQTMRDLQRRYRRTLTPEERMAVARALQTQGVLATSPEQE
jgi:hypothetical protein